MNYTAEEVRARFEAWLIREHEYAPEDLIWQEKRNCYADYATHLAWNAYRDAYADLLERIKADEGAVPTFSRSDVSKWRGDAFENAAQIVDRYAEHFPEVTGAADDIRALIAHPPAQAAQSCEKCKGRGEVFNDVHVRMMTCPHCHGAGKVVPAEPVAQDYCRVCGCVHDGQCLFTRPNAVSIVFDSQEAADRFYARMDETMKVAQNTAPSIDLAAVREVIESHINEAKKLRHDPESQDYLYEQANKLEAALQEKSNG